MANYRKNAADLAAKLPDDITSLSNKEIVDTVVSAISAALEAGDDVYLNGVGLLNIIARKAKSGVLTNIKTGEEIRWEKPRRLGVRLDPARALEKHLETLPVTDAWDVKTKSVKAATDAGATDAEAIINAVDTNAPASEEPANQPAATPADNGVTQNDGA